MPQGQQPLNAPDIPGFSAPKGVERACPSPAAVATAILLGCFSAPKGVERACPAGPPARFEKAPPKFQCPEGR